MDKLDEIAAAQRKVAGYERKAQAVRDERDAMIREALGEGVTAYRVAKITGMTQPAIYKIRDAVTRDT